MKSYASGMRPIWKFNQKPCFKINGAKIIKNRFLRETIKNKRPYCSRRLTSNLCANIFAQTFLTETNDSNHQQTINTIRNTFLGSVYRTSNENERIQIEQP